MNSYSLVVLTSERPEALQQCLHTIEQLDWSGSELEVIVVHDASSSPAALAQAFPNLKMKFVLQDRTGVSKARNLGVKNATKEFVSFIADDYLLPGSFLRDVDDFFMSHPEARVITHNIKPVGFGLFVLVQHLYLQLALAQEFSANDFLNEIASSFSLPASRAAVFRRNVFNEIGLFDETLETGEDRDISIRLAKIGAPVFMLTKRWIKYDESRTILGYARLRIRYGRSYVHVLGSKTLLPLFSRHGYLGILVLVARKISFWWTVAKKIHVRIRFFFLLPLLTIFLGLFYLGAFLELKKNAAA